MITAHSGGCTTPFCTRAALKQGAGAMCTEQAAERAAVQEGVEAIRVEGDMCCQGNQHRVSHECSPQVGIIRWQHSFCKWPAAVGAAARRTGSPAWKRLRTQAPAFRRPRPLAAEASEVQAPANRGATPGYSH